MKKQIEEIPEELKIEKGDQKQLPANAAMILSGLKSVSAKLGEAVRKIPVRNLLSGIAVPKTGKVIIIPAVLIAFVLVLAILYLFTNKATVVLSIDGKKSIKTKMLLFRISRAIHLTILFRQNLFLYQKTEVSQPNQLVKRGRR